MISVLTILNSVGLKDWKECFHLGTQQWFHWTRSSRIPHGHVEFLMLLYQQAKKKVTYWQSDWSWLPRGSHFAATQQGSKDNAYGTPVFFQMPPGIFICNSKSFWKTITTKKSLTIKDSDTLRMKIWSYHQVKDLGKLKYYLRERKHEMFSRKKK